jgi:Na+-translocating ferredoxin:NAD+ oxidoreductase RnfC subunit
MMLGFVAQGLKTFPQGGIHPEENKLSAARPIEAAPLPQTVIIPLSQHIGAPAKPVVNQRDKVKVGQLIAQGEGFVSANIYTRRFPARSPKSTNISTAPATSATPS